MSYVGLFVLTNYARVRKILVIARKRSARFRVSSALGALGRRFESCCPDSLKPSHTSELLRLAFLLEIMSAARADKKPTTIESFASMNFCLRCSYQKSFL